MPSPHIPPPPKVPPPTVPPPTVPPPTAQPHSAERLWALYEIGRDIAAHPDTNDVLRSVIAHARQLLGADTATLCLLDGERKRLVVHAVSGPEGTLRSRSVPADDDLVRAVLQGRTPLLGHGEPACGCGECDGLGASACAMMDERYRHSQLAAPLRSKDRVIGALCVGSAQERAFSSRDGRFLEDLARSAALALDNARLHRRAERAAMLEERHRIAAEMHDGLAQTLSHLELRASSLAESLACSDEDRAAAELAHLRAAIRHAIGDVRGTIASLTAEERPQRPLQAEIADQIEAGADAGPGRLPPSREGGQQREPALAPAVRFTDEMAEPLILERDATHQVLRVLGEAVANARRHAGASRIDVRLARPDGHAELEINDDGRGFEPDRPGTDTASHFGLSIMRARAARLGGRLTVRSSPGRGTHIRLRWPAVAPNGTADGAVDGAVDGQPGVPVFVPVLPANGSETAAGPPGERDAHHGSGHRSSVAPSPDNASSHDRDRRENVEARRE